MVSIAEQDPMVSLEEQIQEATRLLKDDQPEAALALLEPLACDEAPYLPTRFLLSMTAWKMGRLDWALELMRDCHEKWPMHGTVAEMLASLYAQVGNLGESLFMGKLATALGGTSDLMELVAPNFPVFDWAFYNMKDKPLLAQAKAANALGKTFEAIEKARQHSALNPTDGDAHTFLAELLLRAGLASTAVDVLHALEGHIAGNGEFPASSASLYARALTAAGAFADAKDWHTRALDLAPDDAEIAAARIADSVWYSENNDGLAASAGEWVRRFCPPAKPRDWERPKEKLVIGYLVSTLADPLDIAAVAAVARAHDRDRTVVVGYGAGPQNWESNVALQGVFDTWQDIRGLDPATLARFFLRGGLHAIIDTAGMAAPRNLMALARLPTAIRVAWLGNRAGLAESIYDAQIVADLTAHKSIPQWGIAGGYPILPRERQAPVAHDGIHFGSDIWMPQLDHETIELWSSILRAKPNSKLLLRAHDMAPGGNIDRLVAAFGPDLAARIDIVDAETTEEFYAAVDVALMPHRAMSPRMAAEALACGVPPVAIAGDGVAQPYGAFLNGLGLGPSLVAADRSAYTSIALALATPGKPRDKMLSATAQLSPRDENSIQRFTRMIEDRARTMIESAAGVSP
jgi:tetratricopeptide (TPR) repeat protein